MIVYKGGNWEGKRNIIEHIYQMDCAGHFPMHYFKMYRYYLPSIYRKVLTATIASGRQTLYFLKCILKN